ncbi:hypothetical protein GCM10025772_12230 [Ferrimonas gelatinilytica]|uniref:Ig-like domain-containing protein n=1 Tax=Ferrimonas gelatinilytica TaxID=1255257 RepID=A0ABP9S134_9GAMM
MVSWTTNGADYCTSNDFAQGQTLSGPGSTLATAFSYPTSTVSITCYFSGTSRSDSDSIQVLSNTIGGPF